MSLTMKRRVTVLASAITVLLAANIAFAAWVSTATGTGEATAMDHTETFAGVAAADTGLDLYPGSSTTIEVTVTNSQTYPVVVTDISAGESDLVNTDCAVGSVETAALSGLDTPIAAGANETFELTATMDTDADEACASQTFTIPVDATLSVGN